MLRVRGRIYQLLIANNLPIITHMHSSPSRPKNLLLSPPPCIWQFDLLTNEESTIAELLVMSATTHLKWPFSFIS